MAEDKKNNKSSSKGGKKKGGGGKLIFLMTLAGCLVPFGVPTLLVSLGLIPTLVALLTDTDENRSSLATIGYLNFAGVLPFLIELWQNGQTMDAALRIIRDPFSWVVMFGSAGVGQLMLYTIPPIVTSMVLMKQESRLRTLREAVQQLEAIWGPDVGNALPLEAVRQHRGVE